MADTSESSSSFSENDSPWGQLRLVRWLTIGYRTAMAIHRDLMANINTTETTAEEQRTALNSANLSSSICSSLVTPNRDTGPTNIRACLQSKSYGRVEHRESKYAERMRSFFTTDSEEEKRPKYKDVAVFQLGSRAIPATFLDLDGQNLLPTKISGHKITETVALRCESHMSHIRLMVSVEKEKSDEVNTEKPPSEKIEDRQTSLALPGSFDITTETNIENMPANGDSRFLHIDRPAIDTVPNIATFEYDTDDKTESLSAAVYTLVNYQAYIRMTAVDFRDFDDLSPSAQESFDHKSPLQLRKFIHQMIDRGTQPVLLNLTFDPDASAHQRVFTGTPPWARKWVESIKKGTVIAILGATDATELYLDILKTSFSMQKQSGGPLCRFHTHETGRMYTLKRLIPPTSANSFSDYEPRHCFFDKQEWMTVMAIHILTERLVESKQIDEFCAREHALRLVEIEGAKDRAYLGFLPVSGENAPRLSKNTTIRLQFAAGDPVPWIAHVTSGNISCGPSEFVALTVDRPWDKTELRFSTHKVHTVSTKRRSTQALPNLIKQDPGNKVLLTIASSHHASTNLLSAIEDMNHATEDNPRTAWNDHIEKALLGNRLDQLPSQDAFRSVRSEFPDVTRVMELNERQRAAILSAAHAPAGLSVFQGPPGTGKSKILREITKPFMMAKKKHPVMVVSPSNGTVDTIAQEMDSQLTRLKLQNLANADRYVLRIHSEASESAIRDMPARKTRPTNAAQRPQNVQEHVDLEGLEEITQVLHSQYLSETETKFEGILDPRVTIPHLSAGAKLLEVTGIVQGPATHPVKVLFTGFRKLYRLWASGAELTPDQKEAFQVTFSQAWVYTLLNATVIVATTVAAGMDRVIDVVKKDLRLLMVDEAAHEREDNLIPFFAARFTQLDGFIQVGDSLQLPPTVLTRHASCVFVKQMHIPFMARLITAGIQVIEFNEQHRMVDDICELANDLTYDNKLVTSETAKLRNRELAGFFRKYVQEHTKNASNIMVANVIPGPANETKENQTGSRFNDLFVIITAGLVQQLLNLHPTATVAALTGYRAQKQKLLQVKDNMLRLKVHGADRFAVATFDGCQGEEYDYVIVNILTQAKNPTIGFQKDKHRMNVALTRARNGQIIVADIEAVKKCSNRGRDLIARAINSPLSQVTSMPRYSTLPPCDWYRP